MHSDRNLLLFQNWMHDCGVTTPILLPMPPDHGISDMVQPVLSCTAETGGIQFKIYFLKHLWKYSKPIPCLQHLILKGQLCNNKSLYQCTNWLHHVSYFFKFNSSTHFTNNFSVNSLEIFKQHPFYMGDEDPQVTLSLASLFHLIFLFLQFSDSDSPHINSTICYCIVVICKASSNCRRQRRT